MEKIYEEIKTGFNYKEVNGVFLITLESGKEVIFYPTDEHNDVIKKSSLQNITYASGFLDEEPGLYVEAFDKRSTNILFDILVNRKKGESFEDLLAYTKNILNSEFEELKTKFLGDYGEALYIYNNGGQRTENDFDTFDIFKDGEQIELKSYTQQKRTVTVSIKQFISDIDIYVVLLEETNSPEGLTIIDLANKISDKKFSDYLITKYSNSSFVDYKFLNNEHKLFDKSKIEINFDSSLKYILKGKLELFVEELI